MSDDDKINEALEAIASRHSEPGTVDEEARKLALSALRIANTVTVKNGETLYPGEEIATLIAAAMHKREEAAKGRCPICLCVVDGDGHGHHSAQCVDMRARPRAEVEASEDVGFDGMTDRERYRAVVRSYNEMKESYDAETRRAEAAKAERDRLQSGLAEYRSDIIRERESKACIGPQKSKQWEEGERWAFDYALQGLDALLRAETPEPAPNQEHDLYKTGDTDAPDCIKDRNGEIALNMCRKCGKGEAELYEPCIPKPD